MPASFPTHRPHRHALTLIEILVSVGILVTACLVIMALLPASLQAQQMTRYRIYAAASAVTVLESFSHSRPLPNPGAGHHGDQYRPRNSTPLPRFDQAPRPGWASHLRSRMVLGSAFANDLEQIITNPNAGAIPVPLEIARRLESDNDEIRRLLDGGGALLYLDPAMFRGLTQGAAATGASAIASLPEEFHHLVFAVVSPAQQNVLPAHPFELAGPAMRQYPFPPIWQQWRSVRGTALGGTEGGPPTPRRSSTVSEAWTSPILATATTGDPSTTGGVHRPSATAAEGGLRWADNGAGGGVPYDDTQPIGEVHGVIWKYLADLEVARGNLTSPWVTGWWSFKRLAGDEFAGWLPVAYMLEWSGTPPTYQQLVNYRDRALHLWMQVMPASHAGAFPAPIVYSATPSTDANGKLHIVQPGSQAHPQGFRNVNVIQHGLEYYDTAVDNTCWSWTSDVDPGSPWCLTEFRWVEPMHYADDAQKTLLAAVPYLDPYQDLPAHEFPPHPAQVLALSYLAHASLLVAGAAPTSNFTGYSTQFTPNAVDPKVTEADRLFARRMHEMSLRWAIAYANERPADYGAPRPDNRPIMNDRVLTHFDLWFDNVARSTIGPAFTPQARIGEPRAVRISQNTGGPLAGAPWDKVEPFESFYRWVEPPNPNLMRDGSGRLRHVRSHVGPYGFPYRSFYTNIWSNAGNNALQWWRQWNEHHQVASLDGSPWPNWLSEQVAGDDSDRHWIDRPFAPQHRARELVYWAVDWKSYEDAEEAPSFPIDFARSGRIVQNRFATPVVGNWFHQTAQENDFGNGTTMSKAYGGPEASYAWRDAERTLSYARWLSTQSQFRTPAFSEAWIHLGAFGADRNMNGIFDRGPIPRATRLRAQTVARFAVYDPILRLDVGGM